MDQSFQGLEGLESVRSRHAGAADQLFREFGSLREELTSQLRRGDWERLAACLDRLGKTAEAGGYREICLRAQSIVEVLGPRGSGRDLAGGRIEELCQSLLFQLSHVEWREQERIGVLAEGFSSD